ncbi:phage tail terminator-like protein [Nisaea nitritireducens]|uniref:phage tail terminator-like protein n=1 Tax=Nisaea nitritireducens TaxID=568392 RepID=UPI0018683625|nr:phage tail terminator-like protein [Nisaea nitritireducens]
MSFTSARRAVESFFGANWLLTPIAFENVAFSPPEDGRWVKLMILHEQSEQAALGSPALHRYRGRIMIYCFTPLGGGAQQATALADAAAALFNDALIPAHVLLPPEITADEDIDGAYRAAVAIPFWRDEIH